MSKKQTAVQWLADKIAEIPGDKCNELTQEQTLANHYAIKQALQMEREQIEEASFNGVKIGVMNCSYDKIENIIECDYSFAQKECSEYYTQTYE